MMYRAVTKNEKLIALLKSVRGSLDEEQISTVDNVLGSFENDTPPASPTASHDPIFGPRHSLTEMNNNSCILDESQFSGSTGSIEGFNELEEDLLDDSRPCEIDHWGHNSEEQWMRMLERKPHESSAEPGDSTSATPGVCPTVHANCLERIRTRQEGSESHPLAPDYYFYLDNNAFPET